MFRAVDVRATKKYTSPNDPDKDNPTVFEIGVIDPALRAWIDGKISNAEFSGDKNDTKRVVNINTTQHALLTVKFGLRGFSNFMASDGVTPVQFKSGRTSISGAAYECVVDEQMSLLSMDLIQELAEVILSYQGLSEEERKN